MLECSLGSTSKPGFDQGARNCQEDPYRLWLRTLKEDQREENELIIWWWHKEMTLCGDTASLHYGNHYKWRLGCATWLNCSLEPGFRETVQVNGFSEAESNVRWELMCYVASCIGCNVFWSLLSRYVWEMLGCMAAVPLILVVQI